MKITICGSSAFRKQMVEYKEELERLGHQAIIHPHYIQFAKGNRRDILDRIAQGEHAQVKKENDYIRWYHRAIQNSHAVLVLNFEKRGIKNYVGGNTLMEMAFAYVNEKKIFMVNPIPDAVSYKDEIEAMEPIILTQGLSQLNRPDFQINQESCDHKSVGILVWKNNKLLLIERKRPPLGFAPPAGHVDEHGGFLMAAKNELKEEVGLDASGMELVAEGRKDNPCRRGSKWHYWKIYRAETQGRINPSPQEAKRAGWCSKGNLQKLAERTKRYLSGSTSEAEWQKRPGLELVWYQWLSELNFLL